MKKNYKNFELVLVVILTTLTVACTTDKDAPGVEYMPDMYRSPALEAYIDYGNSRTQDWIEEQKIEGGVIRVLSMKPPKGTIPFVGENSMYVMPYSYTNTVEEYERAGIEVHSLLKPTKANIEAGQVIYTKMCVHCHGEAGHGDGAISKNGFIAGIPDYATKLVDLPEGKMFHTITYGKGLMGSHASQLNQQERWQVIEYVKTLQKGITPEYDTAGNLVIAAATDTIAPASTATPIQ